LLRQLSSTLFPITFSGPPRDLPSFPTRRSSDLGLRLTSWRYARQFPRPSDDVRSRIPWPPQGRGWWTKYPPISALAQPVRHPARSEEHTSELQSRENLVCRLLLEKKKDTSVSLS